ncbi:MAG: GYD domain-containing protein [Planctomycetota bacterium]|jgi:uncharacterized protein with GYD domain
MPTYIIFSRFSPDAFGDPREFKELAAAVSDKIKSECPGVTWKHSYATLGRFDVVDVVESPDPRQVEKAAMVIRAFGHSTTETMLATPWDDFLEML